MSKNDAPKSRPPANPRGAAIRYIISNRRAGLADDSARKASRAAFDKGFQKSLAANVAILGDSAESTAKNEDARRVIFFEGDREELVRKRKELSADALIEPERPRISLVYRAIDAFTLPSSGGGAMSLAASAFNFDPPTGTGEKFGLKVTGNGKPVIGATVILVLGSKTGGPSTKEGGVTDENGQVTIQFDASSWFPNLALVEPRCNFWTWVVKAPVNGQELVLPALPKTGPLNWWQMLAGNAAYSEATGKGIRVGVVDTGVGPNAAVAHVTSIGAFIDGNHDPKPAAGLDVSNHGTHVSGIIGARPPSGSNEFGGIAPGADVFVARVFPRGQTANQGDIANAIEALSGSHTVDLINLSLGGAPSEIEHDAVLYALEKGTLCVCAAGNNQGGPVLYPAGYPESVAVSALGMPGMAPAGTTSAMNIPSQPDHFGLGGMFLASFSNVGPQITCISAGNGIISTVPATAEESAPYLAMDGTSMASPVTTATLAARLSADPYYQNQPRTIARATYATNALRAYAISLGLKTIYQGIGMPRA